MKKLVTVTVLALALVATLGSAEDEEPTGSGGATTTTVASGAGDETEPAEAPESTEPGDADEPGDAGAADEVDDVVITEYGEGDFGYAAATIEVTNNSSKASNYLIEVAFESADGTTQVGTGFTSVSSLGPGQKKLEEVSGLDETGGQEITCRVSSVERYAA